MSTTVTPKTDSELWGIYHTDTEYVRELGDSHHAIHDRLATPLVVAQ